MCVRVTPRILPGMRSSSASADWCRSDFRAALAPASGRCRSTEPRSRRDQKEASVQTDPGQRFALCCGSGYKSPLVPIIMATFPHYAPRDDGVRSLQESSLAKVQQPQESEEFSIFSLSLSSRLRRLRRKGRRRDTFSVRTSQRGFSVRSLLVSTRLTDGGYHA